MEQPLVSVIVPVYNAGEHIARCIESIRRQSYQNLEIIIVNDGSKDVSLHVCEMYARVDKRILLIDKANSGVSATRNLAMEMAKGKYLQFADSDDYLAPDATRLMVEALEPSIVYMLPYDRLLQATETSRELDIFYRKILEYSLIVSQVKADSWRFETASERYHNLLKHHPEVVKRAPMSHIASYLLMTPETLSRVRANL